jgi:hypothetical protein
MRTRRLLLHLVLAALVLLHVDAWNWDSLSWVAGLPAGFLYHVVFCFVVAAVMGLLLLLDHRTGAD